MYGIMILVGSTDGVGLAEADVFITAYDQVMKARLIKSMGGNMIPRMTLNGSVRYVSLPILGDVLVAVNSR